ncbi:ATP-binding cassette domain-containing protein [Streptomyces massasporeus]|uniref:ABC transporter ATP-binding protein n=1 Tax=Streptomyces massasporeus TaxID=67324 RepID=UPI003456A3BC
MTEVLLQVRNAHMRFGGVHSLRGVSINVRQGRITGLIGPNGAGKTTLFNVASGLLRLQEGSVHAFGQDVTRMAAHRRARLGIGRSFQNLGLLAGENIRVNTLASQFANASYGPLGVQLPRRRERIEAGLWTEAQKALAEFDVCESPEALVGELSFGVARRVELAGLAARRPRLLLLDEPTTGLDTAETEILKKFLRRQREAGRGVLVVAHDVGFVLDMCDEVYVLAEGSVIFHGTPDEARVDDDVVRSFLGKSA